MATHTNKERVEEALILLESRKLKAGESVSHPDAPCEASLTYEELSELYSLIEDLEAEIQGFIHGGP